MPRLTPRVRRTLAVMAPGMFGAGVTQLNLLISTALASLLPGGSVSYLYYADRLNQLPLGVVGIAVGTAILPPLSRQVRLGHAADAVATQNRGVELALLLTLPAAVALAVLAQPILSVLFQRGAFGPADAAATAAALAAYAAGLPAFVLVKVLAPGFLRAPRHRDAGQGRDRRDGGQSLSDLRSDAVSGACRDRARVGGRRLGQRADPARAAASAAGISGSTAALGATCRGSALPPSAWGRAGGCCGSLSTRHWPGRRWFALGALTALVAAGLAVFALLALALGVDRLARLCAAGCAGNRLDRRRAAAITGAATVTV